MSKVHGPDNSINFLDRLWERLWGAAGDIDKRQDALLHKLDDITKSNPEQRKRLINEIFFSLYTIEFLYSSTTELIEKYPSLSAEQEKCIITYQDNLYLKRVGLRERIAPLDDRCKAVVGKFKSLVNAGSNKSSGEIYITDRNGKRFSEKGYVKFPNQIMFTEIDVTGTVSNTDSPETIFMRFRQRKRFDIIEDISLCNAPDNSAFPAYSEKAVEFNASFKKKEGNVLMYEAVLIHPETEKPIGRILLEPMSQ